MDRKLFHNVIYILVLLSLTNCQKDNIIPPDKLIIDTISNSSIIKNVNQTITGFNSEYLTSYRIDVNGDSQDDFEFASNMDFGTAIGFYSYHICIKTLNQSSAIDIIIKTDTMAKCSYTIYHPDYDSITFVEYTNYSDTIKYPTNLELSFDIDSFPKIHTLYDTLNRNNSWHSGVFTLNYETDFGTYDRRYIRKGIWDLIDRKFIGIKYSQNNIDYFGWIQIGVDGFYIKVYNYALLQ